MAISSQVHIFNVALEESRRNSVSRFGSPLPEMNYCSFPKRQQFCAQPLHPSLNPAHCTETKEIRELPLFPSPSNSELIYQQSYCPNKQLTSHPFVVVHFHIKGKHRNVQPLQPGFPLFKLDPASVCMQDVRVNDKDCTFEGKQNLPSIEIKFIFFPQSVLAFQISGDTGIHPNPGFLSAHH